MPREIQVTIPMKITMDQHTAAIVFNEYLDLLIEGIVTSGMPDGEPNPEVRKTARLLKDVLVHDY